MFSDNGYSIMCPARTRYVGTSPGENPLTLPSWSLPLLHKCRKFPTENSIFHLSKYLNKEVIKLGGSESLTAYASKPTPKNQCTHNWKKKKKPNLRTTNHKQPSRCPLFRHLLKVQLIKQLSLSTCDTSLHSFPLLQSHLK